MPPSALPLSGIPSPGPDCTKPSPRQKVSTLNQFKPLGHVGPTAQSEQGVKRHGRQLGKPDAHKHCFLQLSPIKYDRTGIALIEDRAWNILLRPGQTRLSYLLRLQLTGDRLQKQKKRKGKERKGKERLRKPGLAACVKKQKASSQYNWLLAIP
eukprot:1093939-Pelagomonas_calceolata.AAC.1